MVAEDPAVLWERYIQLTQIEAAFRIMKSELGIGPSIIGSNIESRRTSWWRFWPTA
jgi:hypothetical protein